MVASIGHYIDNKPVAGKSGRSGDITNPATGEVTAKVAFASVEEVDAARAGRQEGAGRLGRHAADAPPAHHVQPQEPPREARRRPGAPPLARARQDLRRRQGRGRARPRGRRVRLLRSPITCKGDFTEQVATEMDTWSIRQPLGVVAGITPFNFPIMIPVLDGRRRRSRPRQRLHPEAVGEGSVARRCCWPSSHPAGWRSRPASSR